MVSTALDLIFCQNPFTQIKVDVGQIIAYKLYRPLTLLVNSLSIATVMIGFSSAVVVMDITLGVGELRESTIGLPAADMSIAFDGLRDVSIPARFLGCKSRSRA